MPFLYSVYCDSTVRANSRTPEIPPLPEFQEWVLAQPYFYLASYQGVSIGYGRFTVLDGESVEISYALVARARGFGYGRQLVRLLTEDARARGFTIIVAQVKSTNAASLRVLMHEGYKLQVGHLLTFEEIPG